MDKDFIIKEDNTQLFIDGKEVQPIGEYEMNFAKEAEKTMKLVVEFEDKLFFSKIPTDKLMELRDKIIEEVNRRNS
jgi:hypothetical protein